MVGQAGIRLEIAVKKGKKFVGAHLSIQGGLANAPKNALAIGASAFAIFLRNQREWVSASYQKSEIDDFRNALDQTAISTSHILPHSSYLINLASPEAESREKSIRALIDEVQRCRQLGLGMINFHLGSHKKRGLKSGSIEEEREIVQALKRISDALEEVLETTSGEVKLVLENSAGQGGNVGYRLEHLAYLIEACSNKERIGVCIDTCHLFASGYDIRSPESYHETWNRFEREIGIQYLAGLHLNDSIRSFGSRLDRHQSLGAGEIGIEPFRWIMNDLRFNDIPLILETINPAIWPKEIELLNSFTEL